MKTWLTAAPTQTTMPAALEQNTSESDPQGPTTRRTTRSSSGKTKATGNVSKQTTTTKSELYDCVGAGIFTHRLPGIQKRKKRDDPTEQVSKRINTNTQAGAQIEGRDGVEALSGATGTTEQGEILFHCQQSASISHRRWLWVQTSQSL